MLQEKCYKTTIKGNKLTAELMFFSVNLTLMESQDTINKILEFWLFLLKVDDISNVVLNTAHSAFLLLNVVSFTAD